MSLKIPNFFLVALFFLLTACHGGKGPAPSPKDQNSPPPTDYSPVPLPEGGRIKEPGACEGLVGERERTLEEEVRRPLSFQWSELDEFKDEFEQIECQDCPPSFGHLIRKIDLFHDGEVHTITKNCQGSLIDGDFFLTTRHCLPSNLSPGDSCEEDIRVILPEIDKNNPMKILGCDQLIRVSKNYEGLSRRDFQPDWAILKLKEKSPGRFLRLNTDSFRGISDNESLFGFLLLKGEKTEEISVTQIKCVAVQNSLELPEFNSDQSPLGLLKCDRPLGPGFSGMTLFRKNEDQQYSPVSVHSHSFGEEREMSVVSQVICMGEGEKPEFCEFDPDKKKDHINKIYEKSLEKSKIEIDEQLKDIIGNENNPIRWQRVNSGNWKNLPERYLSRFNRNIEKFKNLREAVVVYYMQNQVPVYPECVRRSFVPDEKPVKIPVRIPTMKVSLTKVENQRVATYYRITYLNAELILGSNDPEEIKNGFTTPEDRKFLIRFISQETSHEYPRNTIVIRGGFDHGRAVIPLCPK